MFFGNKQAELIIPFSEKKNFNRLSWDELTAILTWKVHFLIWKYLMKKKIYSKPTKREWWKAISLMIKTYNHV